MKREIPDDLQEVLQFGTETARYLPITTSWHTSTSKVELSVLDRGPATLSFGGEVPIAESAAQFVCEMYAEWWNQPPTMTCSAPWLRKDIEWHAYGNGRLCWVYPPYWRSILSGLRPSMDWSRLRATAAYWFAEHSLDLLHKHLEADRLALKKWPSEWRAWPHGESHPEVALFRNMKKRGEIERDVQRILTARAA